MSTVHQRACQWVVGRDTGSSSKALWATMMGVKCDGSYPSDPSDLGRCQRLLALIPEWKPRLSEMSAVNGYWAALVKNWAELEALYSSDDKQAGTRCYVRMKAILDPIEAADPNIVKLGNGASLRFGRGA